MFPHKIHEVRLPYNNCFVMVEVNDIGEQVINSLQFDLEYDNLVMGSMRESFWSDIRDRILWWKVHS